MPTKVYLDKDMNFINDERLYADTAEFHGANCAYRDVLSTVGDYGITRAIMKVARRIASETHSSSIEIYEMLHASLQAYLVLAELEAVVLTDEEYELAIADVEQPDDESDDGLADASEMWARDMGYVPCSPSDVISWLHVVESLIDSNPQVGTLLKLGAISYDTGDEIGVMLPKGSSFALRMLEREDVNGRVVAAVCDEFGGVRIMRYTEQS